jgi:hypothetical protein
MVTPYARRADSRNVNRHTRRAMIAMGVTCKQSASTTNVKKGEEDGVESTLFVQQLQTEKQTENTANAYNGCARTTLAR